MQGSGDKNTGVWEVSYLLEVYSVALRLMQLKTLRVTIPEAQRMRAANADTLEPLDAAAPDLHAKLKSPATAPRSEKAGNNPSVESVFDASNQLSKMEARVALSAFGFIVFVLAAAWFSWDEQYSIVGDAEAAYNYGLVGGSMMLIILVYALRKRVRALSRMAISAIGITFISSWVSWARC